MDDHAQWEIREYARTIGNEIVARWCPIAWEAFHDYRMESMSLTGLELPIVKAVTAGTPEKALEIATGYGWLRTGKSGALLRNRERLECEEKLARLNISAPWL